MDRIILCLALFGYAALGWAEGADWLGRSEVWQDPWRGVTRESKQPFGAIKDDGANNGKISLACDPHTDKRVAGYRLHYGTATGVYTMTHDCRKSLEVLCTVSGLTNGTTYYFAAVTYGLNPAITSTYSTEVSGTP